MSQLDEFRQFVKETHGLVLLATGAGILGSLVGYFVGVAPPWPSGFVAITAAAQLLALMIVFLTLRTASKIKLVAAFKAGTFIAVASLFFYLLLYSFFIFEIPTNEDRIVLGFYCSHYSQVLYRGCPFLGSDALAASNYEPDVLWMPWSVYVNRFLLLITWLTLFTSFVYLTASFSLYAMRH